MGGLGAGLGIGTPGHPIALQTRPRDNAPESPRSPDRSAPNASLHGLWVAVILRRLRNLGHRTAPKGSHTAAPASPSRPSIRLHILHRFGAPITGKDSQLQAIPGNCARKRAKSTHKSPCIA